MEKPRQKQPLSARKRAAILANLAKANAVRRTPESYARSRHNATKHGLFVRSLKDSFERLGEDPREFRKFCALVKRAFPPEDATEKMLVRRLAEAFWRRLRVFHAAARWEADAFRRLAQSCPTRPRSGAALIRDRGYSIMLIFLNQTRLSKRLTLLTGEVERMIRLLLTWRSGGEDADFHCIGRQFRSEISELSTNPKDWARRYAAAVPLIK